MKKSKIKNQISKFKNTAGILNTRGKLNKALLEERLKEKELEEKKWAKFYKFPDSSRKRPCLIKEKEVIYAAEKTPPVSKDSIDSKLFFHNNSIWIYNDDFLKTDCLKDNSIDLIITSPPYNVDIHYNSYDDKISYGEYLNFTEKWLAKCFKLARDDGRFCLNIPLDKNKGGQQSVCADITTIAKQVGWRYHSTIIWNEQNISRRTAWGSWLSARAPYVIAPVEVIVILYKKYWKKINNGKSDITKKEFIEWTSGVWNFMGESRTRVGHPAPFPVELPRRCIKLFSFVGDIVLDPFLGSGSTLLACLQNNRKGIGVDIDKNYCELAKKRLIREGQIYQLRFKSTGE